jgi:hypothetical protein
MEQSLSRVGQGFRRMRAWSPRVGLVFLALSGAAIVQAQNAPSNGTGETVTWTLDPVAAPGKGSRAILNVRGVIREGWHVYALKQSATGPTPLVVSVEQNAVATVAGPVVGSTPIVAHNPAFGFVTPYYARNFSVTVPVRLRSPLTPGRQVVPLSIRYQSCDGRICLPPKTVHLTVPITISAKA